MMGFISAGDNVNNNCTFNNYTEQQVTDHFPLCVKGESHGGISE